MDLRYAVFPLLVFAGGCCYGPAPSVLKTVYADGILVGQAVIAEYFTGLFFLMMISLLYLAYCKVSGRGTSLSEEIRHLKETEFMISESGKAIKDPRAAAVIFILCGVSLSLVSWCYLESLQRVPASVSVLLLFQFVWMGVLIDIFVRHIKLGRAVYISVVMLFAGTIAGSGVISGVYDLDAAGILFGLGSAFFYSLNFYFLGKVKTELFPLFKSTLVLAVGSFFILLVFGSQLYLAGAELYPLRLLYPWGLILGGVCCALPVTFFVVGTPKLSTGLATILSSSELPASIICTVIFIHETVMPLQWAGIAVILIAISYPQIAAHLERKQRGERILK